MTYVYPRKPAVYTDYLGDRFKGNAFVEALHPFPLEARALHRSLALEPPVPTDTARRQPQLIRMREVDTIKGFVYPRTLYERSAPLIIDTALNAYYARLPLTVEDAQRRHIIGQARHLRPADETLDDAALIVPAGWANGAAGYGVFGASGSGKTTLIRQLTEPLRVVIEHTRYRGRLLNCVQIPLIALQIPHDATLRSLCLQFFKVIDEALGQNLYEPQGKRLGRIAEMVLLMIAVATAVSLGAVWIDELQNLRAARGRHAEITLNLFAQLIELAGVSLVVSGTPAVGDVLQREFRGIRKLTGAGSITLEMMSNLDGELDAFMKKLWPYQWVKKPGPLTSGIKKAWYRVSAGNPALLCLSFMLAQRHEIGANEELTEDSFYNVYVYDMAFLQPAVEALLSKDEKRIATFDDLLFDDWLKKALSDQPVARWDPEEFAELAEDEPSEKRRSSAKAKNAFAGKLDVPALLARLGPRPVEHVRLH